MQRNRNHTVTHLLNYHREDVFSTALFVFPDLGLAEQLRISGGVAFNYEAPVELLDPHNKDVSFAVSLTSSTLADLLLQRRSAAILYLSGEIVMIKGSASELAAFMGNFVAGKGNKRIVLAVNLWQSGEQIRVKPSLAILQAYKL